MSTKQSYAGDQPEYDVTVARGCTRYTLRIKGAFDFPACVVTAAVIPDRMLGAYRVTVAAGNREKQVIVRDLCMDAMETEDAARAWARECIRAAHQFWADCDHAS